MSEEFSDSDVIDIGDLDVSDAEEPMVLPEGNAQLRILGAELKNKQRDDGSSTIWINIRTEAVDGGDNAMDVYHTLFLPPRKGEEGSRTPKQINRTKHNIKQFCETFGLPTVVSAQAIQEWVGAMGWVDLKVEKDNKGKDRNAIRTLLPPR